MTKKDILIEENLKIATTVGTAPIALPGRFISIFPALAHRNFQLYVAGQLISLIGFWLHQVGLGWLILQLTHSAFWVGAVAAIGGLPFLIFTAFAGVFIDKLNKQKLLVWTQVAEAVIALLLGFLVLTNSSNLPLIIMLAFVNGIVSAVDLPARMTFIIEMVGKRDLASAIPINTGLFNAARFIGPALAGILIASWGLAWPFILNGASFLAGIWAILAIRPIYEYKAEVDVHPWDSLKIGLKYSFTHPLIFYLILLATLQAIFLWPYQTLMPIIAEKVFSAGAGGYGSLLASAGAGSLLGAIFTSSQSRRNNKSSLVLVGLIFASLCLLIFAINKNYVLAHVLLFCIGFGLLIQASTLNTLVQLASPDAMRGRIMAVYLTMFVGMMPVGNVVAGVIAQKTSSLFAIGLGASITLLAAIYLHFRGIFASFSN